MDPEHGWRVEVKPTLSGTRGKGLRVVAILSQQVQQNIGAFI